MERCGARLSILNNHLAHVPKHTWFKTNGWGYTDTKFGFNSKGQATLEGNRYEQSGKVLPHLTKFLEELDFDLSSRATVQSTFKVDPAVQNPNFTTALTSTNIFSSQSDEERSFHSHGHTLQEMYAVKFSKLDRCVDIVVYPSTESEVEKLMEIAQAHNVLLVPYGGGTNVTHSLQLDPSETRMIVSVDMSKMNHVRQVNLKSMTATVEAGIAGKDLEVELNKYGVCCGHEPDSVEFSTLGGWISTRASGMKKNVYGNIEDIVLTVRIVTPIGTWEKPCNAPRISTGPDVNHFIMGHEGLFGIITQATIKVKSLPECKDYDSIVFPSFEIGTQFMKECGIKQVRPASIRLVDNFQFRFGMAFKIEEHSALKHLLDSAKKFYVTRIKGYKPDTMCACTLVFEGPKSTIEMQKMQVFSIAQKYNGLRAGPENGKRGYFLTFTIAYIRDFVMDYYCWAESFEASVAYEGLDNFLQTVPLAIENACYERGVKKKPFISSRITQLYDTGCCIYIYFGFIAKDLPDPIKVYAEIEDNAREIIMKCGGSLSHHHGVGKLRKAFMKKAVGTPALEMLKGLQKTIDPKGVMANQNLI